MKKLLIIGNADIISDHSEFVNACDVVIRINLRRNRNMIRGTIGRKTDILCYTPRAVNLALNDDEELRFLKGFCGALSRLWFLRPRRAYWVNRQLLSGFLFRGERLFFDMSLAFIKRLELGGSRTEFVKIDLLNSTARKLWNLNPCGKKPLPSAGIMVIEKVLGDAEYADFEKYLLGFTFEGWEGHHWDIEKMLVEGYIEKGLLRFHPE